MLGKLLSNKTQVEMDSQQFEKYFDVFTTDKNLSRKNFNFRHHELYDRL